MAMVRRQTAADGGAEEFGDAAVWDGWLNHTPFWVAYVPTMTTSEIATVLAWHDALDGGGTSTP